jgi:hypothetical protein
LNHRETNPIFDRPTRVLKFEFQKQATHASVELREFDHGSVANEGGEICGSHVRTLHNPCHAEKVVRQLQRG